MKCCTQWDLSFSSLFSLFSTIDSHTTKNPVSNLPSYSDWNVQLLQILNQPSHYVVLHQCITQNPSELVIIFHILRVHQVLEQLNRINGRKDCNPKFANTKLSISPTTAQHSRMLTFTANSNLRQPHNNTLHHQTQLNMHTTETHHALISPFHTNSHTHNTIDPFMPIHSNQGRYGWELGWKEKEKGKSNKEW